MGGKPCRRVPRGTAPPGTPRAGHLALSIAVLFLCSVASLSQTQTAQQSYRAVWEKGGGSVEFNALPLLFSTKNQLPSL